MDERRKPDNTESKCLWSVYGDTRMDIKRNEDVMHTDGVISRL